MGRPYISHNTIRKEERIDSKYRKTGPVGETPPWCPPSEGGFRGEKPFVKKNQGRKEGKMQNCHVTRGFCQGRLKVMSLQPRAKDSHPSLSLKSILKKGSRKVQKVGKESGKDCGFGSLGAD